MLHADELCKLTAVDNIKSTFENMFENL